MNDNEFWQIIDMLNWSESSNDKAIVAPAVVYLADKSDEAIAEFEELLAQKLHEIDTKAHAREIGKNAYRNDDEYFSADAFLYARCAVVARGKKLYEQVRTNPSDFPKDVSFEPILYVAQAAFEQKNNRMWEYLSPTDYETFRNVSGWQ